MMDLEIVGSGMGHRRFIATAITTTGHVARTTLLPSDKIRFAL